MSTNLEIRTALERSVKTLKLKPAKGRVTRKATIRIVDGLTCEVSERDWKMTSDVNRMLGGHESAPSPSTFARMALGSCLAMGYAMWFSRLDVPYDGIEVDVEADMDFSGFLGTSSLPIESPSSPYTVAKEVASVRIAMRVRSPSSLGLRRFLTPEFPSRSAPDFFSNNLVDILARSFVLIISTVSDKIEGYGEVMSRVIHYSCDGEALVPGAVLVVGTIWPMC